MTEGRTIAAGLGAAACWMLLGLRWFDAGAGGRPAWLSTIPPWLLALLVLVLGMEWGRGLRGRRGGAGLPGPRGGLLLAVGAAVLFRLPLAMQGAAGYVTADGALSGIMAVQIRAGAAHPVFVPSVPYSGSLKSHLSAPLAALLDPARALALVSVVAYALFVAAVYRLAQRTGAEAGPVALAAGLYLAFAPAFVTRYSLSNDGNYVEVLALGAWALVLVVRWVEEPSGRGPLAVLAGLLLGLAAWCHILAVMHVATVGLVLVAFDPRRGWRSLPALALGLVLGYWPGLLWNASHGWESIRYLLPGGGVEAASGASSLVARLSDQGAVLLGYDPGYPPAVDALFRVMAAVAGVATIVAVARAVGERSVAGRVLLLLTAVVGVLALFVLPYIPGNPRYLLFLMAPLPVFLARLLGSGWRRGLMAAIIAFGALGSLAQAPGALRADAQWREFVRGLEAEGVRRCYTDFFLATKVNFLSEERVVCSSKLGPTTTEYFFPYRRMVESAPEAALVPVNQIAAAKLERRLERLGVTFERRDLMKPVLLRLSRKVDPEELFPGREFPWR